MDGDFAVIEAVEFFDHGVFGGGGWLEGVDLGGGGEYNDLVGSFELEEAGGLSTHPSAAEEDVVADADVAEFEFWFEWFACEGEAGVGAETAGDVACEGAI